MYRHDELIFLKINIQKYLYDPITRQEYYHYFDVIIKEHGWRQWVTSLWSFVFFFVDLAFVFFVNVSAFIFQFFDSENMLNQAENIDFPSQKIESQEIERRGETELKMKHEMDRGEDKSP